MNKDKGTPKKDIDWNKLVLTGDIMEWVVANSSSSKASQRKKEVSKVATTEVLEADKDVPECLKTEVQEVGKTDVSKVAATDVLEADKGVVALVWIPLFSDLVILSDLVLAFSDILSPTIVVASLKEIVSSKDEDMTNEDEEEFWIKYPKDKGKASNSATLLTSKSKEKCSKSTTSKSLPTPKAREKVLAQQLSRRGSKRERGRESWVFDHSVVFM
ncbi:hypothetical protein Tco_1113895 [Tanacetum coccineum]|uniref:Uncharacterized protein n=1 Tax=Tanacetum coccineum TaxID=301880 RepID=A0ABQ5IVR8_9ASTR